MLPFLFVSCIVAPHGLKGLVMIEESNTIQLTKEQARVLASLMEKHLATPKNYPLTINSLMLACNQKSNRDPVMKLSEGQVGHLVKELVELNLAGIDYGSRTNKITHRVNGKLSENRKQQAILCMLMLRAPLTLNDIKARTERMVQFESLAELQSVLNELTNKDDPLVVILPKGSGQREDRFTHLLCGKPELEIIRSSSTKSEPSISKEQGTSKIEKLEARIAKLEEQMNLLIG